jgi:hypothetical protein
VGAFLGDDTVVVVEYFLYRDQNLDFDEFREGGRKGD